MENLSLLIEELAMLESIPESSDITLLLTQMESYASTFRVSDTRKENTDEATTINFLNDRCCSSIKPPDFSSFLLTRLFARIYSVRIYSCERKTFSSSVDYLRSFNENNSLRITSKLLAKITSELQDD